MILIEDVERKMMTKTVTDIILSSQQQAVIDWVIRGRGSLEVVARAGCGKTFTLMQVIATIVQRRLGDVAIMAYNKKIADEIRDKLEEEKYDWRTAQAGTVHSFGFNVWRKLAPSVKVDDSKLFNIVNTFKDPDVPDGGFFIVNRSAIQKLCSLAKQRALGHIGRINDIDIWFDIWDHFGIENDVTEDVNPEDVIKAAIKIYQISLEQCRQVIDFDDMILAPLYFKARFWPKDWILVDESQDTNPARRALALAMLKPRTGRMIFVGDPAQAIYGFTGADSDSMNQLKVATNATTLPLNVTRRCPKTVVDEARRLVPDFIAHEDAPEGVVRNIEQYDDLLLEKLSATDVILCRNTAPLIQTAYMLISKGIACRVEGREIGTGLIKLASRFKAKNLNDLIVLLDDYQLRQTATLMSKNQEHKVEALVDQIACLKVVIDRCFLARKHKVTDLIEDIEKMFGDTKGDPVLLTLSTVHKSKGREWTRVYLLGRDRYMPSPYAKKAWQQEQETNLEYVAITRAMSELIQVPAPPEKKK